MSTIIKLRCIDQVLTFESTPVIASGGLSEDTIQVEFCSKWDGLVKTAVFWRSEDEAYHVLMDDSGSCLIPREVLTEEGVFYFGVYGVGDGRQRTTEAMRYTVVQGTITSNTKPSDPTPDIYTQLLTQYNEVKTLATKSATAAEASRVAAERAAEGAAPAGFGLGTVAKSITDTDLLDTLAKGQSGWYRGVRVLNGPAAFDRWCYYHIIASGTTYSVVMAYPFNGGEYRALYDSGVLGTWVQTSVKTHTHTPEDLGVVPITRKVNGQALSADITLGASDVGARPANWTPDAAAVGAVPTTREVNGQALSADITLGAADVGARPADWTPSASDVGAVALNGSNFMTNDFNIKRKEDAARVILTNETTGSEARFSNTSDAAVLQAKSLKSEVNEFRQLRLANTKHSSAPSGSLSKALMLYSNATGESGTKYLLHTGNVVLSQTDITAGASADWQQYLVYL